MQALGERCRHTDGEHENGAVAHKVLRIGEAINLLFRQVDLALEVAETVEPR